MSHPLTESEKAKILDLHYSGYSNDEIHNTIGKSTGSVSGVITKHMNSVNNQEHDSAISLGRIWRKNGLSLEDVSVIMHIMGIFKKNGMSSDKLPEFLKTFSYIDENKITLEEFMESSKQVRDIQKATNVPVSEIPQKLTDLQKEYESLKTESERLDKDITIQEKALEESIESKNTTKKQLGDFTETRDFLIKSNIDVKNYEKFGNMIKSAHTQKFDMSKIITNLQKEDSISTRISQLESREKKLSNEIKLKEETITKKQSEINQLDSKYNTTLKDWRKKKEEVSAVESLSKSGVTSSDIKSWNKIMSNASIDVSKLAESTGIIEQLTNKIKTLKGEINVLKNDIVLLSDKKSQLDLQVKKLELKQDGWLKLEKKIKEIFSNAVSYSLNNAHTMSQKMLSSQSKDVKELFTQLEKNVNQLASQLDQRVNEILSQDEKIIQHTKILNDVNFILPLYEIIIGKDNYPKSQVLAVYSTVTSALINWCISKNMSHTPFAKSLKNIDESIKLLLLGTSAA